MVTKKANLYVCSLEFVVSASAENTMFQQSIEMILLEVRPICKEEVRRTQGNLSQAFSLPVQ